MVTRVKDFVNVTQAKLLHKRCCRNILGVLCWLTLNLFYQRAFGQKEDFDLLSEETPKSENVNYAFKTTKVINLQSLETTDYGVLDFKMLHRFGALNSGPVEAFGLDQASVRFGLEYGISENLMISLGRSNVQGLKNTDAFLKYRLLHQKSDESIPVSLLVLAGAQYALVNPDIPSSEKPTAMQRSSFVFQTIVGRKFSENFSMLLSPTYILNAKNEAWITPREREPQNLVALGAGLRYKITPRTSINLEYIPIFYGNGNVANSFSLGVDIETGGHVFQLHVTNSAGLNETQFIANTLKGGPTSGLRLGFNLSRVFTIVK
jgi:hypothetical protein